MAVGLGTAPASALQWGRAMAGLCQQPMVAGQAPSAVLASTRDTRRVGSAPT
jgi:hypothetical protein